MQGVEFYRYTLICITSFGVLFLILNWIHIKTKINEDEKDIGLLLLSGSLVMWIYSDYYIIYHECSDVTLRVLSTLNNGFLISSLPYFEKINEKFHFLSNKKRWGIRVILFCSLLIPFFLINPKWNILVKLDFFISAFSLGSVGLAIAYSFYRREYGVLFIATALILTLVLVYTQILAIYVYDANSPCPDTLGANHIIAIIAKVGFVSLLLMLSQTWVVEETVRERTIEIEKLKKEKREGFQGVINSKLSIGLDDNGMFFFDLSLPDKEISNFIYRNATIQNVFLFLLFYAYAKTHGKTNNIKDKIRGYSIPDFNNAIIQSLNPKLLEKGFAKINRDDLFQTKMKNWELKIAVDAIHLLNFEALENNDLVKDIISYCQE